MPLGNNAGTEIRTRLRLRSTVRGANNRLDVDAIMSYDRGSNAATPMLGEALQCLKTHIGNDARQSCFPGWQGCFVSEEAIESFNFFSLTFPATFGFAWSGQPHEIKGTFLRMQRVTSVLMMPGLRKKVGQHQVALLCRECDGQ